MVLVGRGQKLEESVVVQSMWSGGRNGFALVLGTIAQKGKKVATAKHPPPPFRQWAKSRLVPLLAPRLPSLLEYT